MIEANVTHIVQAIQYLQYRTTYIAHFRGAEITQADANSIVFVSAPSGTEGMLEGDTVTMYDSTITEYDFNVVATAYTTDDTVVTTMNNSSSREH